MAGAVHCEIELDILDLQFFLIFSSADWRKDGSSGYFQIFCMPQALQPPVIKLTLVRFFAIGERALRVDSARGALVRVVPSDLSFLLWQSGRVDAARAALVRVPSDAPLRSGVSGLAELVQGRFSIDFAVGCIGFATTGAFVLQLPAPWPGLPQLKHLCNPKGHNLLVCTHAIWPSPGFGR